MPALIIYVFRTKSHEHICIITRHRIHTVLVDCTAFSIIYIVLVFNCKITEIVLVPVGLFRSV